MTSQDPNDPPSEQEIATLIAALPPAPPAWVAAAQELPAARAALDGLAERAAGDAERRAEILRDLEGALRAEGVPPRPALVAELRSRLDPGSGS